MRDAFLKLHLSVLVAGATGLFGRLISLQEIPLVWYRLLIATLFFLPILYFQKQLKKVVWRDALKMAGVGMLLGVHPPGVHVHIPRQASDTQRIRFLLPLYPGQCLHHRTIYAANRSPA